MCNNPEIVTWSIAKLLELDNNTPQWASASILTGSTEEIPDDFFLNLSKEAITHYNGARKEGGCCEVRYDDTILLQAKAFLNLLTKGNTDFKPRQQDDYCFSRVFNLISKEDGENRWPELKGHESNRLEEIEIMIKKLENNQEIDSRDHRVVQAIAMLALLKQKQVKFSFPECISKSWPQFWKFLDYMRRFNNQKTF